MTKSSPPVLSLLYLPILSSHDDPAQLETMLLRHHQPCEPVPEVLCCCSSCDCPHACGSLNFPCPPHTELCTTESVLTLLQDSSFLLCLLYILIIRSCFFSGISQPKCLTNLSLPRCDRPHLLL